MAVDLESTFLAGVLTIGGALACLHGWRLYRRRRLIQDTPTARIRSMAMGLVEVTGAVRGRSLVTAPFSGHSRRLDVEPSFASSMPPSTAWKR